MVADSLVYHPTVAHYLRFVATTIGRDKLLRTIQYFARFLTFYLHRKGHGAARIAMFAAVKTQLGLTRKLMRVGKNVEHFKAAGEVADKKGMDPILRYCAVGRQLGYGVYLTFDSLSYLDAAGIWKSDIAKKFSRYAFKAWLVGILFSIASGLYSLRRLKERASAIKASDEKTEAKKLAKEKQAVTIQLVSDLADFSIPASALGYVNLDEGFVGLSGMLSSLIGLRAAWAKTA